MPTLEGRRPGPRQQAELRPPRRAPGRHRRVRGRAQRRVAPRRHQRPREAGDRAARRDGRRSARPTRSASTASCSTRATCRTARRRIRGPRSCPSPTRRHDVLVEPVAPNDSPEGGCKVPAGKVFVMGDNRGQLAGLARQRPDQGVEHRRARLRAHLAARAHRLHVTRRRCRRSTLARTRRRSRPCGATWSE